MARCFIFRVVVSSVGTSKSIAVGRNGVNDGRWLIIAAFVFCFVVGGVTNNEFRIYYG
jgi:hypothetical protein